MHNYEKLIKKIRNNEIVLWVGAGFSKYAGVPMGGKLVEIIKENAVDYEKQILKDMNLLPEVAEEFFKMRSNIKTDLIAILKKALLFDIGDEELFVHKALKNIPQINTIITTNFDTLFEQIYKHNLEVIIKDESISTAYSTANEDKVKLLKIHSDFTNPDLMIITKSDYTKFFEQESYRPLWTEIKSIIAKKSILFIGYSLEDQNIRYIFEKVLNKLGAFSNECFFASPNLPDYKQKDLLNFNISYIPMGAEELIPKIEKDIKEHLIEDIRQGLVDYKVGRNIIESYGVKADFKIEGNDITLSSINSLNSKLKLAGNINLKVDKENLQYVENINKMNDLLEGKSFEAVIIPGECIGKFDTRVGDIPINRQDRARLTELKLEPTPYEEYDCDIYFDEEIENETGKCKFYVSKYMAKQEVIHNCFKVSISFDNKDYAEEIELKSEGEFQIKITKPSSIFEGNRVIKKIIKWFDGGHVQVYKKDDYSTNFELPALNKEEMIELYELCKTHEYIFSNLILFQRHFNINFNVPDNITDLDIENIHTLKQYIENKNKIKIDYFSLNLSDTNEIFKQKDNDTNELKISVNSTDEIALFGKCIELGKPNIICDDIYVSDVSEIEGNKLLKKVVFKSKSNNLFISYEK